MNYRLNERQPRNDWPKHLAGVYKHNAPLNKIVGKFNNKEITSFSPYNSLVYWSKNVNIFIEIEELHDFLSFFGHEYDVEEFEKQNVSKKTRGVFNSATRERIKKIYSKDMAFFNAKTTKITK
jgi:hypothetical protein